MTGPRASPTRDRDGPRPPEGCTEPPIAPSFSSNETILSKSGGPFQVVDPAPALTSGPSALAAYEALAPFYDRFTADITEHEPVLRHRSQRLARQHGLRGFRLLDVACGTGKSFLPLMRRGYEVTACDISPGMVELARRKLPPDDAKRVVVADMRLLPWRGAFDLVTCLDDAVNYLLTDGDLEAALRSMSAALRPGGVAVFDVNSLRTYRELFAEDFAVRSGGTVFVWRGRARPDVGLGVCARRSSPFVPAAVASGSRAATCSAISRAPRSRSPARAPTSTSWASTAWPRPPGWSTRLVTRPSIASSSTSREGRRDLEPGEVTCPSSAGVESGGRAPDRSIAGARRPS